MDATTTPAAAPGLAHPLASRRIRTARLVERAIVAVLAASAAVAVVTTAAIFLTLALNGAEFFAAVDLWEFLSGTRWAPDFLPPAYGSVPLLKGTVQIAVGACLLGIPLGVGSALYLSEFAGDRTRRILKPTLEVLAGIPSIVFGLLALFVVGPFVQSTFGAPLFTALAASLALGVMVVPIISSISDDALRAVPRELREGALALGATKWEATWKVVLPAARSGITAATILGFSRAIGETMVVTMAAGLVPTMTPDYLQPAQTITSFIANRAGGDLPQGSMPYLSIFALGAYLFALTFAINLVAERVLARYRRRFA